MDGRDRLARGVDAQYVPRVGSRDPKYPSPTPTASPSARPRERRSGAEDGASVEASRRRNLPGSTSSAQRASPARTTRSTGPSNSRASASFTWDAPRASTSPVRQSSATSRRDPSPLSPTGLTEAMRRSPMCARDDASPRPGKCTMRATAPVEGSMRSSGRSTAGRRGSPFRATQSVPGPAATGPG